MDSDTQKLALRKRYVVLNNRVVGAGGKAGAASVAAASASGQPMKAYVAPTDSDTRWGNEERERAAGMRFIRRRRA